MVPADGPVRQAALRSGKWESRRVTVLSVWRTVRSHCRIGGALPVAESKMGLEHRAASSASLAVNLLRS